MAHVQPAFYFPIDRKLYDVSPGLKPLGFDFGNGALDANLFQIDSDFARYRAEKLKSRAEDLSKYHGVDRVSPLVAQTIVSSVIDLLVKEWPQYFESVRTSRFTQANASEAPTSCKLICHLTGERLSFNGAYELIDVVGGPTPPYLNAFDALFSQVQEDAAILTSDETGNRLSMLHVLTPSHWDPRDKLGKDFAAFHKPVPGFDKMAKAQHLLVDAMINKGPFTRFVWSFVTDQRLNHHPVPPLGQDATSWKGRAFDASRSEAPFFLRVERQTTYGFSSVNASLFLIRLSFIDGFVIRRNQHQREQLVGALESMTPEARVYKGVSNCFEELTSWLKS